MSIKIAYYDSLQSEVSHKLVSLDIKFKREPIEQEVAEKSKEALEAYKQFKFITPSSSMTEETRTDENCAQHHTGIIGIDIDEFKDTKLYPTPEQAARAGGLCLDKLRNSPSVMSAGKSLSGMGIHCFFAVDPIPSNDSEHRIAWAECVKFVAELTGHKADKSGINTSRFFGLSYDENAEWNWKSKKITWEKPQSDGGTDSLAHGEKYVSELRGQLPPTPKTWRNSKRLPNAMGVGERHVHIWAFLTDARQNLGWSMLSIRSVLNEINKERCQPMVEESRVNHWLKEIEKIEQGVQSFAYIEEIYETKRAELSANKQIALDKRREFKVARGRILSRKDYTPEEYEIRDTGFNEWDGIVKEYEVEIDELDRWKEAAVLEYEEMQFGDKLIYRRWDRQSFFDALDKLGIEIYFDTSLLVHCVKYEGFSEEFKEAQKRTNLLPSGYYKGSDHIDAALRGLFEDKIRIRKSARRRKSKLARIKFNIADWGEWLHEIAASNQRDCFLEWIESLPKWDGTNRLKGLLRILNPYIKNSKIHDKGQNALIEWASFSPYLAAIKRRYEPGLKHDAMPVLVGPQGGGKSTYVEYAFPKGWRRYWHTGNLELTATTKEVVEQSSGVVFAEFSELVGSHRALIERIKNILSTTVDKVRLAYGRVAVEVPRKFVFIATANDRTSKILPRDSSGHRRFVVIYLKGGKDNYKKVEKYLDENREQLWAEALDMHNRGEQAALFGEVEQWSLMSNEGISDISIVQEYLAEARESGEIKPNVAYTKSEIAKLLGIETNRRGRISKTADRDMLDEALVNWHGRQATIRNRTARFIWFGSATKPNVHSGQITTEHKNVIF